MYPSAIQHQGKSFPLGATLNGVGANFSVFAKHSTAAQLLLFNHVDDGQPARIINLDPHTNRTYHYWHAFVPGINAGQLYGYRVSGPFDPARGLRFDPNKVLLDPYGKCIARPASRSREAARHPGGNTATALKSVIVDPSAYDWEGDAPIGRPFAKTIIYEMHVGGFTRHPSSSVPPAQRGTYAGLIAKIPYLQDLGVSAVELLPVFAFDEFRDMVKALHRAGIEIILDVVYNHTTEGSEEGPTICFRGLANDTYYILSEDKSRYADYTGCGNTL